MSDDPELLFLFVDVDQLSWSLLDDRCNKADETYRTASVDKKGDLKDPNRYASFLEFLVELELFISAFVSLNKRNRLVVIGYNGREGGYLFPVVHHKETSLSYTSSAVVRRHVRSGLLQLRYGENIKSSPLESDITEPLTFHSHLGTLGSCLTVSISYIQRQRATAEFNLRPRILVFQVSQDLPSQYIPIINTTYSAQRFNIPIDSCIVNNIESVFLQQAAHLTGGLHLQPNPHQGHFAGFVQYLIMEFLPSVLLRQRMTALAPHKVNLRAHCFCHHKHQSVAYLCTICLSIWCKPEKKCRTCGAGVDSLSDIK